MSWSSRPWASAASLWRIVASRCRNVSAARLAAAAGLFNSWVSPADSLPRASSRSRFPTKALVLDNPTNRPCSRCTAIGYQRWNTSRNSRLGSAKTVPSLSARTDVE